MRRLLLVASLVLPFAALPGTARARGPAQVSFWVSPDGSDRAAGTLAHPFLTPFRARAAVRAVRASRPRAAVSVYLRGGTYRLARTLVLDSRDSGRAGAAVTWRAAGHERPVLSGAIRVRGWKLHDPGRGIWVAKVTPGLETRQLYVDGRRATRARSAEYPPGFTRTASGFQAPDASLASWRNPTGVEVVTVTQWKMMRCPVASVAGRLLTIRQPCWTNANVFPYLWSFQTLTWLENAYELLDRPGEWYLDSPAGRLYYVPRLGERLGSADVELPVREALLTVRGTLAHPVRHLRFTGLTFAYGTWLAPSGPNGYAADQSGFHLNGTGHRANLIGHDPNTVRTPGNARLRYAQDVIFSRDDFLHLGGAGLDLGTGSRNDVVVGSRFTDISSSAIELGGVAAVDHHPAHVGQVTADNTIADNLVRKVGREYEDAAGIYVGFTTRTRVVHNDVAGVPWSGIAVGWGWGLLDPGGFPGVPNATAGQWGPGGKAYTTPTTNQGGRIVANRISRFLQVLWDGGAIYTTGFQGASAATGALIAGNVALDKRRLAAGNVFYTDGGSRYIRLERNVSLNNPPGLTDFGPCWLSDSLAACGVILPYGSDTGGCRPYGNLTFAGNYWEYPHFYLDACPFPPYPLNVTRNDHTITSASQVPASILAHAGLEPAYHAHVGAG